MEMTNSDDQGIVYKKNSGHYYVRAGQLELICSLAAQHEFTSQPCAAPAVGDWVRFRTIGKGRGQILNVLPRHNQFSRQAVQPGWQANEQVLAANLDQVVPILAAASPAPKWGLLDRYLVTAEAAGLAALVCINKIDLVDAGKDKVLQANLAAYQQAGYALVLVSAKTGQGLDELSAGLQGRRSALLGKSGVGKTSLLNALQPGLELPTQALGRSKKARGKHTTTHLEMFALDEQTWLVDTPGMRQFGLWDLDELDLPECFPEMRPYLGRCKFGLDCRHDSEPGCTVRQAVLNGEIHPLRYRAYMRLREDLR